MRRRRRSALAERLMRRVLPRTRTSLSIIGDLREELAERSRRDGQRRAIWWHRRQVAGLVAGHLIQRLRAALAGTRLRSTAGGWRADVRSARRSLVARPGLGLAAAVAIGAGVASVAAVGAVSRTAFSSTLPFEAPEDLVFIWGSRPSAGQVRDVISGSVYTAIRRQSTSFMDVAAFESTELTLDRGGVARVVPTMAATPNLVRSTGARVVAGRSFTAEDGLPGRDRVVMLGYRFWQRELGGDPGVIGTRLDTLDAPRQVIGVLPPGFRLFSEPDLVVPLRPDLLAQDSPTHYHYWLLGRLRRERTSAAARDEVDAILTALAGEHAALEGWRATVDPASGLLAQPSAPAVNALLITVAAVLLIGAANVATLWFGRGLERRSELVVREALGASRWRIARQLLVEQALLGGVGTVVGLAGAWALIIALGHVLPPALAIRGSAAMVDVGRAGLDPLALTLAATCGVVLTTLVGLGPVVRLARLRPAGSLSVRGGIRGDQRWFSLLAGCQVALVTGLLVIAGMSVRTVVHLWSVDTGFDPARTLSMYVGELGNQGNDVRNQYYTRVVEAVSGLPGVEAVGLNDYVLLQNEDDFESFLIDGVPRPAPGQAFREEWRRVTPGYFDALAIPTIEGRMLTDADTEQTASVAVVNQSFARRYFSGESPVGRRIRLGARAYDWTEIVGVVGDVRFVRLDEPSKPMIYVPRHRAPRPLMALFVRTAGDPEIHLPAIRAAVYGVDRRQPVFAERTLSTVVAEAMALERFTVSVAATLAALSLLLAAIGLYSVMSFVVSARRRELGLRLALGARPGALQRWMVQQGLVIAAGGLTVGLTGASLASVLLGGVAVIGATSQPSVYAAAAGILGASALAAVWLPARRAAGLDPLTTLRDD